MSDVFKVHGQMGNRSFFLGMAAVSVVHGNSGLSQLRFAFKTETPECKEVIKSADAFQFVRQNKVYEI